VNITITINTDNAAFENYAAGEVSHILAQLARDVRDKDLKRDVDGLKLRDGNGNTVGKVEVSE
jgi:hypothetical protein